MDQNTKAVVSSLNELSARLREIQNVLNAINTNLVQVGRNLKETQDAGEV